MNNPPTMSDHDIMEDEKLGKYITTPLGSQPKSFARRRSDSPLDH